MKFQRDFLDHGVSHLRPLVLKDVANDIGMHESTVSRATANKYVHTPQGIFELKYFFTSSLRSGRRRRGLGRERARNDPGASSARRTPRRPLSDQYIAELLAKENIDIARRTVAKYRELMGILPSSKRRQVSEPEGRVGAVAPRTGAKRRGSAMQVNVTFRHIEATAALRRYAEDKVQRVAKYLRRPIDAHVILSVSKRRHIAEIILNADHVRC